MGRLLMTCSAFHPTRTTTSVASVYSADALRVPPGCVDWEHLSRELRNAETSLPAVVMDIAQLKHCWGGGGVQFLQRLTQVTPLRSGFHFLLHFSASPRLLSHSVLPGKPCHRSKLLQDAGVGAGSTTSGPCHVLAWWTGEIFPPPGCPGAGGEPSLPGALVVAPCLLPACCSQTCEQAGGPRLQVGL